MGAAAAEHRRGTRRRRDPAEPVGQQYHDRQGADAAPLMRLAIGALHRRLRLFRRRRRQIDDRSRLGRPGRHLRDWRAAWPRPSAFRPIPKWRLPMSISAASARSGCAPTPLATARARPPRAGRCSARSRSISLPPREPLALRREIERFPYVPADPAMLDDNCYEAYNIQVQGLAQRLRATGLKKLVIGVSGGLEFDAGADCVSPRDGPARAAAHQYSRLYPARLCDRAKRPRPMPGG